ncbi:hypothetical protein SmJEL517_g01231 [Synchytrium microbalum]|uniref:Protein kinase domain-containing protein n=1 Tax=Synchytrium microbalum TaxID=1806994 RepID=A0A507CF56_9FUNG|nr:uncharacterized protein SmJEL517_g01231 [Synchytrium microbalum]TPX36554.1 hypothetical protein SmJEL517_g01231 [Synchytrium microbalum]
MNPSALLNKHTPDGTLLLVELIGSGSFSLVYRALSVDNGTEYAVKCLFKVNLNPHQLAIQRQEASILSMLPPHINLIQLERVIESPHVLFLVFEYLSNDLFDTIMAAQNSKEQGLSDEAVRDMMLQICSAVKHCHDNGIYHRDIKPENILVKVDNDDGGRPILKLADFGLATMQSFSNDIGVGSLRYQSPQALRGSTSQRTTPDSSSASVMSQSSKLRRSDSVCLSPSPMGYWGATNDVWALGVVLINLITGRNPWAAAMQSDPTFAAFCDYDKDILNREFGLSDATACIMRGVFEHDEDARLSMNELMQAIKAAPSFRMKPIRDKTGRYTTDEIPNLEMVSSYTQPHHFIISQSPSPTRKTNPISITTNSWNSRAAAFQPKIGIAAARSYKQSSWSSDLDDMNWEALPQFDESGTAIKDAGLARIEDDEDVDSQEGSSQEAATPRLSDDDDLLFSFDHTSISRAVESRTMQDFHDEGILGKKNRGSVESFDDKARKVIKGAVSSLESWAKSWESSVAVGGKDNTR